VQLKQRAVLHKRDLMQHAKDPLLHSGSRKPRGKDPLPCTEDLMHHSQNVLQHKQDRTVHNGVFALHNANRVQHNDVPTVHDPVAAPRRQNPKPRFPTLRLRLFSLEPLLTSLQPRLLSSKPRFASVELRQAEKTFDVFSVAVRHLSQQPHTAPMPPRSPRSLAHPPALCVHDLCAAVLTRCDHYHQQFARVHQKDRRMHGRFAMRSALAATDRAPSNNGAVSCHLADRCGETAVVRILVPFASPWSVANLAPFLRLPSGSNAIPAT